ncbi:MAG TPA: type II secretion system protein GspC [Woeseiaceae bacterium]|nr:type II secretion system protein GspC [Woeseiaceae bacterium]|tara:strand:+ start:15422 stop:16336 length:915 start_codon:yes stop_codon:yes gene_type:complete
MINLKKLLVPQDLYIDSFKDLIQNKGPIYLSLTALLLIIWQSSQLFWSIFPKKIQSMEINIPPSMSLADSKSETLTQPNILINNIVDQHLFGRHAEKSSSEVANNETDTSIISDLKETKLNLSLNGVIHGKGISDSIAIISNSSGEEEIYTINDMIITGTTLHSVYSDQVILNSRNGLESLKLPKDNINKISNLNNHNNITTTSIAPLKEFGTKLADTIRPTPYFVGGKQTGYRVYPGSDRKQFMALGLISGDLITNVNGNSIEDPRKAIEIFQSIENENKVTLTIIRNDESREILIDSNQFMQ